MAEEPELCFDHEHSHDQKDHHSLSLAYQTYLRHDDDEKNHFDDVCRSFRQYAAFAMSQWANQQYRFHALPESQRDVLPAALKRDTPEFNQRASLFKEAAIRNQFCLDCILRHAGTPHSQQITNTAQAVDDGQISKVSSLLKSLARDWSVEGKAERDMAYEPIIAQIKWYLPLSESIGGRPKICVPGAGKQVMFLLITCK
jgi:carnosine N-methyltransferase